MERSEILTICDALNEQANRFSRMADERAETRGNVDQACEIWWRKAEDNRALARKLLGKTDDEAVEWGRRAGSSGMPMSVCPYIRGDAARAVWRNAYVAARNVQAAS